MPLLPYIHYFYYAERTHIPSNTVCFRSCRFWICTQLSWVYICLFWVDWYQYGVMLCNIHRIVFGYLITKKRRYVTRCLFSCHGRIDNSYTRYRILMSKRIRMNITLLLAHLQCFGCYSCHLKRFIFGWWTGSRPFAITLVAQNLLRRLLVLSSFQLPVALFVFKMILVHMENLCPSRWLVAMVTASFTPSTLSCDNWSPFASFHMALKDPPSTRDMPLQLDW